MVAADRAEVVHGSGIPRGNSFTVTRHLGVGGGLQPAGAQKMNWSYELSGALALALLVYLVVALIRAEDL